MFTLSQKEKDPVCGMKVKIDEDTLQLTYQGKIYYFCSNSCRSQFEKDPKQYVNKEHECCGGHHHHKGHGCCS